MKRDNDRYCFWLYTFLFTLFWISAFIIVFSNNKTLIIDDDCYSASFENYAFKLNVVKDFLYNLRYKHSLSISFINYNFTGDSNLSHNLYIEPLDVFFLVFPRKCWEFLFQLCMFLRMWTLGFLFFILCKEKGIDGSSSILGSLTVVFCNYAIYATTWQPVFIYMMLLMAAELWGIELLLNNKSGLVFRLVIFLNVIAAPYFFWYNSIILICYSFILFINYLSKYRAKILVFRKILFNYIIGSFMGGIIIIPLAFEIIGSSRVKEMVYGGNLLSFGIAHYINSIGGMFVLTDRSISVSFLFYGFLPLSFFYILCLFYKDNNDKFLKYVFLFVYFMSTIPFTSRIFGLSTMNGRWSYIISFVVGIVVAKNNSLMPIYLKERKFRLYILWSTLIYVFFLLFVFLQCKQFQYLLTIVTLLLMAVSFCVWLNNYKYIYISLITISILSFYLGSFLFFDKPYMNRLIGIGEAITKADNYFDAAYTQIVDDSFYRVDKSSCVDEHSCNLPYWFGFDGISSYQNVINASVYSYFSLSGNVGLMTTNKVSDLDSRITPELLSNVKYYITDDNDSIVPYGFNFYKQQNGSVVYINTNNLGVSFAYDNQMGINQFLALNPAQQDEAMLKYVILDGDMQYVDVEELNGTEIDYHIEESNVEITLDGWVIPEDGGFVTLSFDQVDDGEIFIQFPDVSNTTISNMRVIISNDAVEKSIICPSELMDYTSKQNYFVVNLGNLREYSGTDKLSLQLKFVGNCDSVDMMPIHIYQRSLADINNDVESLKDFSVKELIFQPNSIEETIELQSEKWIVFSIPYEKGWTCYVDGKKRDLQKADIMLMGVKIEGGCHTIILKYFPYGMKIGIVISMIGVLLAIFYDYFEKRRKLM